MSGQSPDPIVGSVVSGRYRVVKRLGEGGMGQVYLAIHDAIEKKIALKVLRPEYSAKEEIITRFQQEAISASRIKHPNVLEVFDFGMLDNGCAFLAMEFLQGNDVADELVRLGSLETPRALRIVLQVCRALTSAHKAGVVHRDMKPDNIFLLRTDDGEEIVKIVDFGIAQLRNPDEEAKSDAKPRRRLTKTGMIFGTPEYMAPEQAAGKAADLRVDVYATGIILFEMLTGAVPFTGDSFMAVLAAHLNDPAPSMMEYRPDLQISQELHNIVARMLAKKPEDRFQSMAEVSAALLSTPEAQGLSGSGEMPMSMLHPGSLTAPVLGSGHVTSAQFHQPSSAATASTVPPVQPATSVKPASHTLEAATTSGQKPKKSNLVGIVAGVLGVGVLAGGGALAMMWPKLFPAEGAELTNNPPATSEPESTVTVQPEASSATTALAPSTAAPPAASAASSVEPTTAASGPAVAPVGATSKVRLTLETTPTGAKVSKGGFQVCDATPCEIEVDTGEAVELSADLNGRKGSAKVLAQQDQTVTIALKAPKPTPPKEQKLCEVPGPGGLKIFRPCQ